MINDNKKHLEEKKKDKSNLVISLANGVITNGRLSDGYKDKK